MQVAERSFVVLKDFKGGGQNWQSGDVIRDPGWHPVRLTQLVEQRYIAPATAAPKMSGRKRRED